jgi:molecular chaperone IbpA
MTRYNQVPGLFNFNGIEKVFVGWDDQFQRLARMHDDLTKNIPNYPPCNIKKTADDKYVIEMALAGFGKSDIEIELDGDKLNVKSNVASDNKDTLENFLFKGISNRAFTRAFTLGDNVEVQNAEMLNGMLRIFLEKIIPEHKKPKKIEVAGDE